jgi:5-methylcytosine-specific restriction enzyme A
MVASNWNFGKVEAAHVEQAAKHFVSLNRDFSPFKNSLKYDVEINGDYFPPKAIASMAHKFATGYALTPYEFGGAQNGPAQERLRALGFSIHNKAFDSLPEEVDTDEVLHEGSIKTITVNAYERNREARAKCIKHHGYACLGCGFDFLKTYGETGRGFIHVHHLRPLAEIKSSYVVDPVKDLVPLCPNCHSMIHSEKPAMSLNDLKKLITK